MAEQLRVCVDKVIHKNAKTSAERMALVKGSLWPAGAQIKCRFLDGDPAVQERVKKVALEWMNHANLKLYFVDTPDAVIRITFTPGGSWSYIGTDCKKIPAGQATMQYGWLTKTSTDEEVRRVVLHEFGHALGAIHEHQNPAGSIKWNKEAVYKYYMGPPNNWSKADVDHNLFETYDANLTVNTALDPTSIMMYPIPKEFTTDGFNVGWNMALSATDKAFMKKNYP